MTRRGQAKKGGRRLFVLASAGLAAIVALAGSACVDTLPEEDLRILSATPVAKLSAALLWKDFQDDAAAARARYWGKAVEVTGTPTQVADPSSPAPHVMFGQAAPQADPAAAVAHGVKALILRDRAAEILAAAKPGERLTLKCFCDGLADGNLILRSCVRP
jgi:hypothetical protein